MPPPMHKVAKPLRAPLRCSSYSKVVRIRAPEALNDIAGTMPPLARKAGKRRN